MHCIAKFSNSWSVAIKEAEKKDSQKRDWLAKKLEEVRKQRVAICHGILQKQARAKVIAGQLAERAAAALAIANTPVPTQVGQQLRIAQVPSFPSNTKS